MSKIPTILILIGIPASGKSTFAIEYISSNKNYIRVNRDNIRKMLRNSLQLDLKGEELVTAIEYNIVENAIAKNLNVIWDNTHLKESYINNIIKKFNDRADINFKIFEIDLEIAIERDSNRLKPVGKDVINKMYSNYINLIKSFEFYSRSKINDSFFIPIEKNEFMQDCVIFDIDGTLANKGDRGHFDWNKVDVDYLNPIVSEHIDFHKSKGRRIIIFSGRDSASREKTIKWLNEYNLQFDDLYMRPFNDFRKDSVIKKELYDTHIKNRFNVHCIYDDRVQVIDMWYDENLFVFNVNQGNKIF